VFTGHVQVHVSRFASGGSDLCLNLAPGGVQDITKDDFRPFTRKEFCLCGALTASSAANQGNFAIESAHTALLRLQDILVYRCVVVYYTLIWRDELWYLHGARMRSDG